MSSPFWAPLGAFALAALLSLALTPLSQRLARRLGMVDRPDGRFKRHPRPVPTLGGLAVYGAFAATLLSLWPAHGGLWPLLLGGAASLLLGLLDDWRALPWWHKMPLEAAIAVAAVYGGLHLQVPGLPVPVAFALSVLWLWLAANALNLLDVADGLACSVALVAAAALATFCGVVGQGADPLSLTGMALCGALAGFLPANRPPARQFLGDAGSLSVGFLIAGIALLADYREQRVLALLTPVGIWALPLLEAVLVSAARLRRGPTPFVGSNDHLSRRLRRRGLSAGGVAAAGAGLTLWAGITAHAWLLLPAPHQMLALSLTGALWLSLFVWLWRTEVSVVRVEHPQKLRAVRDQPLERDDV